MAYNEAGDYYYPLYMFDTKGNELAEKCITDSVKTTGFKVNVTGVLGAAAVYNGDETIPAAYLTAAGLPANVTLDYGTMMSVSSMSSSQCPDLNNGAASHVSFTLAIVGVMVALLI